MKYFVMTIFVVSTAVACLGQKNQPRRFNATGLAGHRAIIKTVMRARETAAKKSPGIVKAGPSHGIKFPTKLYHATHGVRVSFRGEEKAADYMDVRLAKTLIKVFLLLKKKYGVVAVDHAGIYNDRNVAKTSYLSRHASATAIDLAAFEFGDGSKISVSRDWSSKKTGPMLRAMRDDLCRHFHVVLGPSYNAAHADHFHVDLDPRSREESGPAETFVADAFKGERELPDDELFGMLMRRATPNHDRLRQRTGFPNQRCQ